MTDETLLNADIPEKFKDPDSGEVRMEALVKSYRALEQKLSLMPRPPKTPDAYCINCDHGLFKPDGEVNQRLHDLGLSEVQAQAVYDLAAERMIPMLGEIAADFQADREVEKLIEHFGGVRQWKDVSRQLLAFGRKNLPDDVLDTLSSSFEGVLALHRMMTGHEPRFNRTQASDKGGVSGAAELSSMMRDPRYWRDKDPAFVAKVTEGFQNLYGE